MSYVDFQGSGWGYPVELSDKGKVALSQGEELIKESIRIILGTSPGERVMRPDFGCGLQDLVFEINNTSMRSKCEFVVEEALKKWEHRIEVINVSAETDNENDGVLSINIDYYVVSSNKRYNMVYPFYLEKK
ncbi:MAG: GPW/gp25 family protein [Spirochaetota bacterium]|nr:GPW/gp25 family protein [Spirochaetota bacterium]